jgi:hypothetical protein
MATKFFSIGLLLIAALLLTSSKCNKNPSQPCLHYTPYNFNVTSVFYPEKETYKVGDTIFFISSFPKIILNTIDSKQVNYSNSLGIAGNLFFDELDTINKVKKFALSKFSYLVDTGRISKLDINTDGGVNIFYEETNINYTIKLHIVPNKKGIYMLSVSNLGSQGIRGKDCTNAGFSMQVANTNKNINLFEYALGYTPDALALNVIYCFRVE